MKSKELRAKRAKLIEDARALMAADVVSAEVNAKFDDMMAEADAIKAQIDRVERSESLYAELGTEINARTNTQRTAFVSDANRDREIFARIVRDGKVSLSDSDRDYAASAIARDQRILRAVALGRLHSLPAEDQQHYQNAFGQVEIKNAGATSSNGGGGYTIAPLFEAELLVALKAWGGVRSAARVIQTDTGAPLPWPTMDDTSNVASILGSENSDVGTGTDLAFGQTSIGSYTYTSGVVPVSLQLLQDSAFNFESLVQGALVTRFGRGQNAHFTTGSGSSQPQGVVTAAASGKVGATGEATSVSYLDLIDLEHSIDPAYRQGAVFMFHDSTLRVLRKLQDSMGRPLWQAGITDGAPDLINGRPYVINQDMPTMAANAKSILFGNFSNYIIRDTLGLQMMVLRERYADKLQVAWVGYMRTDAKLISAASPIKYFANSAS